MKSNKFTRLTSRLALNGLTYQTGMHTRATQANFTYYIPIAALAVIGSTGRHNRFSMVLAIVIQELAGVGSLRPATYYNCTAKRK